MDTSNTDDPNTSLRESRKILKPYRHLFSKPITVKRNDPTLFNVDDDRYQDSGTQTSKTILELAKIDERSSRSRSISPDSLGAPSPRVVCEILSDIVEPPVSSRDISESDTIMLDKKQSVFDLRRFKYPISADELQGQNAAGGNCADCFDYDQYTPDDSLYTSEHSMQLQSSHTYYGPDKALQHQQQLVYNQMPPLHPALYESQNIVTDTHHRMPGNSKSHCCVNVGNSGRVVDVSRSGRRCDASLDMCHLSASMHMPPMMDTSGAGYLMQQQQQQQAHQQQLTDIEFPTTSLVNTFLSKSKNRQRYGGDSHSMTKQKPKQLVNNINRHHSGGYRFKSQSFVDTSSVGNLSPSNFRAHYTVTDQQSAQTPAYIHSPQRGMNTAMDDMFDGLQPDLCAYMMNESPKHGGKNGGAGPCTSRGTFGQRRSNSFMMPTIASERRSCMQEVRQISRLLSPTMRGCTLSPRTNITTPSSSTVPSQYQLPKEQQYQMTKEPQYQLQTDQEYTQQCYQLQMQQLHQLQQMQQIQSAAQSRPPNMMKVPYIDGSVGDDNSITDKKSRIYKEKFKDYSPIRITPITPKISFDEDMFKLDQLSIDTKICGDEASTARSTSGTSIDSTINNVLNKIKQEDWNVALKGLAEVTELCRSTDAAVMTRHMTAVNQRLLDLLRSPRSHVCRTACQAAGHLFESMKDTRKPEFEDIVNTLLHKTADSNKFIRQDANLALDCMVTHIPTFHAIKSLCSKGPTHKNPLVRCATIRLIICAVVIAGPANILNSANNGYTRKRIILQLAKVLQDKNLDTRKYAERLYKTMSKDSKAFESYLRKFLEKEELELFKRSVKYLIT